MAFLVVGAFRLPACLTAVLTSMPTTSHPLQGSLCGICFAQRVHCAPCRSLSHACLVQQTQRLTTLTSALAPCRSGLVCLSQPRQRHLHHHQMLHWCQPPSSSQLPPPPWWWPHRCCRRAAAEGPPGQALPASQCSWACLNPHYFRALGEQWGPAPVWQAGSAAASHSFRPCMPG